MPSQSPQPSTPMRNRIIVAAFALLSACGATDPTEEGLQFATKGARFESGGAITVELTNGSADQVGYNFCQRFWERKVGTAWERIEEMALCTPAFDVLGAGETTRATLGVPYGLVPGTYRVSAAVLLDGDSAPILSNEFLVEVGEQR